MAEGKRPHESRLAKAAAIFCKEANHCLDLRAAAAGPLTPEECAALADVIEAAQQLFSQGCPIATPPSQ
jgi:hypothetical protein